IITDRYYPNAILAGLRDFFIFITVIGCESLGHCWLRFLMHSAIILPSSSSNTTITPVVPNPVSFLPPLIKDICYGETTDYVYT
ncbi:hypothetical protein QUG96_01720, partial [Klebsiella michiganensis]|uniref:hypothetical protein n=1 Tax=Klebsiella michiganensis TaxID=1134687 RepID=UPI0025A2854B